jgi:hypothetical protein
MNDLDLVRELRADIPVPTQQRLASGRGRLLASIARPPRPRHFRRPVVMLAASAAAAAAVTAAMAVSRGPSAPATQAMTVADLATLAATAAEKQPSVRPGQWVYRDTTANNPPSDHTDPHFYTFELWSTADDSKSAWAYQGKFYHHITPVDWRPRVPYSSIGSLPASPRALIDRLSRISGALYWPWFYTTRPTHDTTAFVVIGTMLQSYVMPPRFTAELYRALGDIPGVTVDRNAVTVADQRGIGFRLSFQFRPGFGTGSRAGEIIVSRRTYTYLGQYYAVPPLTHEGRGLGEALLRQAFVSGPGVKP